MPLPTPSSWQQFPIGNVALQSANANIVPDSLGNLWFPTAQGLAKYNISADTISFVSTGQGLVSNVLRHVAVDLNDDVWVSQALNVTTNQTDIVLQKWNGVSFTNYDLVTLFGVKTIYAGISRLTVNPFNGYIFVGESRQNGSGILSIFNGVSWSLNIDTFYGLAGGLSFRHIEFDTVDKWWLGGAISGPSTSLVFWDDNLSSVVYSFDADADFSGGAVEAIALLSTGRLICLINGVTTLSRITAGVVSTTSAHVTFSSTPSEQWFVDKGDLIWSIDPPLDVQAFTDSLDSVEAFLSTTIGGTRTRGGGIDLLGNVWFARDPDGTALLTKGVLQSDPALIAGIIETITTGGQTEGQIVL